MQETWVQPLGWEDPLEKGAATHSSILAWRIPWTIPCDFWVGKIPWRWACQTSSVFLPGESHGQKSLAAYSPWDCNESDMTELLTAVFPEEGGSACGVGAGGELALLCPVLSLNFLRAEKLCTALTS